MIDGRRSIRHMGGWLRSWPALPIAVLMLAGGGFAALWQSAGAAPERSAVANRRSAEADAAGLLVRLRLPAGASRSSQDPAPPRLGAPPTEPATPDLIDRSAWWTVPEGYKQVLAYVEGNPPSGSTRDGGGAAGGPAGYWQFSEFKWSAEPGVLGSRKLLVEVVPLPAGGTAVRGDAQDVWVSPRPATERVPPSARLLEVREVLSGFLPRSPGFSRHVTVSRSTADQSIVDRVAAEIDRLPVVQPGAVLSCLEIPGGGSELTFTFRARRGGPILAQASLRAWTGTDESPCESMRITIEGRPRTALERGGRVIALAGRLLGVKLAESRGEARARSR